MQPVNILQESPWGWDYLFKSEHNFSKKKRLKIESPYDLTIPFLSIYPKELKARS